MKRISRLHKEIDLSSLSWHSSETMQKVRFAIKRVSLRQRIELNQRVKELLRKHEFLKAGEWEDRLDAALSELLVINLYLEWGLECIEGLSIDGEPATAFSLIQKGPEALATEIAKVIQAESQLTETERKNS